MQKCAACQYYDRNQPEAGDTGIRWGKCRRTGPIVHPLSAKAYMVEGVWPHVRDDDWCGEWAMGTRPPDTTKSQAMNSLLMQAGAAARAAPALPTFVSSDPPTDVIQPPISTLMRGHIASD